MPIIKYTVLLCLLFSIAHSEPLTNEFIKTDQLLSILNLFKTAFILTFTFFKAISILAFKFTSIVLTPFLWIFQLSWSILVLKPLDLFLYVNRTLYPITMFCLAAVFCGLFIGGCAGFAAEAVSSIMITATWGPQPKQKKEQEEVEEDESEMASIDRQSEIEEPDESVQSSSSSLFRGKESITTARQQSTPVLIRRMKLSSTNRKNSWDWEEDEDDSRKKYL